MTMTSGAAAIGFYESSRWKCLLASTAISTKQANTKNNYTRLELAAASTRAAIFKRSRT